MVKGSRDAQSDDLYHGRDAGVLLRETIDWSVYTQGVIVATVLSIAMVVFAALNARGALKK